MCLIQCVQSCFKALQFVKALGSIKAFKARKNGKET